MRHIDAFCHFLPQGIFNKLSETTGGTRTSENAFRACARSTTLMCGSVSWTGLRIIRKCCRWVCRRSRAWSGPIMHRNLPALRTTVSRNCARNIQIAVWAEEVRAYIRDFITAVDSLDVSDAVKEKIFYRNTEVLFGVK
jgi:hypothetical protein